MTGGVRAEVAVDRPDACTISDVCGDGRGALLGRSANDGVVHEEFVVEGDVDTPLDEVYADGDEHVYRFTRDAGRACPCERIEEWDCPVVDARVENGSLFVTFHAPDRETLGDVVDTLGESHEDVRVVRILGAGGETTTPDLVEGDVLTERQRRLVSLAAERGYYDTPRECTLTDLADAAGVSKSTASTTLHRAEEQIVKRFLGA